MIREWAPVRRLAALALIGVIVQIAVVGQFSVLGVTPDLSPVLVAGVGLLLGSITGAAFGFTVGLGLDGLGLQTLGPSSLVLIVVGYFAGRLRETRDPAGHTLIPLAVGAAAMFVGEVGYALLQFLLGVDAPVSGLLLRQIVVSILVGTALSLPLYAVLRRVLRPVLGGSGRDRGRRATTTRLSPFTNT